MFGSIHTKAAWRRGTWDVFTTMFTWMIHVADPKEVFSLGNDVAHVK
jgi:hypothetical protein